MVPSILTQSSQLALPHCKARLSSSARALFWAAPVAVPLFLLGAALSVSTAHAQSHRVQSPDGDLVATVQTGGSQLTYSLTQNGQTLVAPSPISMTLAGRTVLGKAPTVENTSRREIDRVLEPVVREQSARVPTHFREVRIEFAKDFALVVRAYNEGAAYRFETARSDSITVETEAATFDLADGTAAGSPTFYWARNENSFITHSESYYQPPLPVDSIAGQMSTLPLLATYGADGPRVMVTEANLYDYPGMFVVGDSTGRAGDARLHGTFAEVPLDVAVYQDDERNTYPTRRADYIARTSGSRAFPWRVVIVAEDDAALFDNQLVYKLGPELALDDTDWINPGKVAWDWYNALNLFGVDFQAGINTRTYKHYIDFAAAQGLDYVILDEGWSDPADLTDVAEAIDMEALTAYAAKKDVGLILWCVWKTLDRQMQTALDQFEAWGIAGIKVDFMQRDDQDVVNFYWRTAREAAERELLVNFHGSYKPTGLRRAYPNVLTREGVNGMEQSKWTDRVTPRHDVTIPFTRMVAGPMDYTPGAMVNAHTDNFAARWARPMSQGTRAHQLAMYVVYESPMQMLADSPSHYRRAPQSMDFLAAVPTTWHETHALRARIGDYVAVARRHGDEWYLGA
ncbi:MAG: glycoside hydrolase family 97 catalytic domain-containing protein, partial [Salinibacter sp.]